MFLRLVSPVKRSGSKNGQFQKRVPIAIRERMIGRRLSIPIGEDTVSAIVDRHGFIRFSLRTNDPAELKARQADALAYLERIFAAEQSNRPVELSRRHAVALAGLLYRAWVDGSGREQTIAWQYGHDGEWRRAYEDDDAAGTEEAAAFRALAAQAVALAEGASAEALQRTLGPVVDAVAARPDVMLPPLAPKSRLIVLVEFSRAVRDLAERRARQAEGDYSPDPVSERFPAWERSYVSEGDSEASVGDPPRKVTLTGLVDGWWKEQEKVGKAKSTYVNYKGVFARLVAFLKHDDARRLSGEDVVRFKAYRLEKGISPRTVNDSDLAAMRSVLGWAVENKKLPTNPATGIRLKGVKKEPGRAYTDEEATALLRSAMAVRSNGRERDETTRAKRWAPWLMAYSGARVGEIAQLRKQDVLQVREGDDEYWAVAIRPEAGTVKGGKSRQVPLHPHLVEMGFVQMVGEVAGEHLFLRPNAETGDVLGPLQGVKNRLSEAARKVVGDKSVDPNHGWRHRFVIQCYAHGLSDDLSRVITGHGGKDVHSKVYGGKGAGLYREICKLPTIKLD